MTKKGARRGEDNRPAFDAKREQQAGREPPGEENQRIPAGDSQR
jgi:hypothetical protein